MGTWAFCVDNLRLIMINNNIAGEGMVLSTLVEPMDKRND